MKLLQWRRACGLWITALCCLTSARAASEISVRKIGGLEIGFVGSNDLVASRDGRSVAMLSTPGEKGSDCFVFDLRTHKIVLVPGCSRLEPLVFSRDGSALWVWGLHRDAASPGLEKVLAKAPFIALYDVHHARFIRAFAGKESEWGVPSESALSRDGSTLIVAWQDGWLRAFSTRSRKQKWKRLAQDGGDGPVSIALSNDGSRFLRSIDDGDAQSTQIVTTRSGRVLQTLRLKLADGMRSAFAGGRFAPRGEMVAVFQPDTQQWVFFDSATGRAKWKMGAPSRSSEGDSSWQWSPDAREVAVSEPNGFELRDARSGRVLRRVENEKKAWGFTPGAFAFSPDGSLLYALAHNDTGFGADSAIWQLRLRGSAAQKSADRFWMAKMRAEEERFALSWQHINQSLILAARGGDDRRVAWLLDKGANIETRNGRLETPLLIAVNGFGNSGPHRYRETIHVLLARGAQVKRDGGFLLASAASRGNDELIRILLKRGVNVNSDAKAYGTKTALEPAVRFSHLSSVRLLLDNGALPDTRNEYELTPLLILAETDSLGKVESDEVLIARLLLDKGADLNTRTPTRSDGGYGDETALSRAAAQGKAALTKFLLERGADANAIDAQGQSPLMKVAQYVEDEVAADSYNANNLAARLKMVRALLAHGAKLDLRDKDGKSAFDLAVSPKLKAALKIPRTPGG